MQITVTAWHHSIRTLHLIYCFTCTSFILYINLEGGSQYKPPGVSRGSPALTPFIDHLCIITTIVHTFIVIIIIKFASKCIMVSNYLLSDLFHHTHGLIDQSNDATSYAAVHTTDVLLGNVQIVFHGKPIAYYKDWPLYLKKLVAANLNPLLTERECPKCTYADSLQWSNEAWSTIKVLIATSSLPESLGSHT